MSMDTSKLRVMASILVSLAAPVGALATVALAVPGEARAEVKKAACKVYAVAASKDAAKQRIPKELEVISSQLQDDQFAAFRSFRLLEDKTLRIAPNAPGKAKLKSGHGIALDLLGGDDKRLKLHATLTGRDGSSKLVSTDYTIENNGVLMIGGVAHEGGKLFFAIQCAAR